MADWTEEEEFGMSKTAAREADPMEQEHRKSAVQDHPDFAFLDMHALESNRQNAPLPAWLAALPVDKDIRKWTILEVQMRPDRSWEIIKELLATLCISKGLVVTQENASSVLFRHKITNESVAHGMAQMATYQNVFVRIGVLPSKLRVMHICYMVSDENTLIGGLSLPSHRVTQAQVHQSKPLVYALDQLLGAMQATIVSQFLSVSALFMATPENSMDAGPEKPELDPEYVKDVKRMFASEMKTNMRDLSIPLEEYAYQQEFACALLLGLLEPRLKKYGIKLMETADNAKEADEAVTEAAAALSLEDKTEIPTEAPPSTENSTETEVSASVTEIATPKIDKCYGEVITEMVHALWKQLKEECESKVQEKIKEKKQQVSARVQSVQQLRARAIKTLMDVDGAEMTSLVTSSPGDRTNVLLYEGSCVVNTMPVKLHVTYGALIYRTMVPFFATTTVIPFADILNVVQTTSLGIRVLFVDLAPERHARGLTVAMGLEVDLLHQLFVELLSMHKQDDDPNAPPPAPTEEEDLVALKTLLGQEEEEEKEGEKDDLTESASA